MNKLVLKIVLSMLSISFVWSATVGTIAGRVTDANSGTPLPGVNVMIPALGLGTATDFEGDYFIQNVPVGIHTVQVGMIGYAKMTISDVRVIMDQSTRINISLEEEIIEGQEILVTAERPLVEKDVTVKKMVRTAEEIKNLPARDLTEMLTLQSGIIQIKSSEYGIPGFEDRGIEEIHVRGGRAGEIGYTIDGMYIENPIYGGVGKGTRLNTHAVQEFIVQTGVFSAEYGDAMSSIVNNITLAGGDKYAGSIEWQTSNLGPLSSEQDQLRNYNKFAGSFSGPIFPGLKKLTFHISADYTSSAYRVMKFDELVYLENDPGNLVNAENKVHWLDRQAGWKAFGHDHTFDVFTKLHWKIDNYKQLNFTHWFVDSEFKTYSSWNQFYEDGKNVNRKWSERFHLEFRHQLNEQTYYTMSASRFTQQMEINVENGDMDGDGYPDWVEYQIGTEPRGMHQGVEYHGECDIPFESGQNFLPGTTIENESDQAKYLEAWGPGCLRVQVEYKSRVNENAGYSDGYDIDLQHGQRIRIGPWDKIYIKTKFSEITYEDDGETIRSSKTFSNGNLIDPLDSLEYKDAAGDRHMWHLGDPMDKYLEEGQYAAWEYMLYPDSTYNLYSNPPGTMSL
ncbi:MAG: TonB-dependent receptor, partial [Candidatus Marinimicrobia bacterium]|nr:TonB-dependent receptor [Candidatus Neomarinimicrobiota bacterium]